MRTTLGILLSLALLAIPTTAYALDGEVISAGQATTMQDHVEKVLEENPGGIQTGWNEASWQDGDIILTISPDDLESSSTSVTVGANTAAAASACQAGRYCAFSSPRYRGSRLSVSRCTSASTNALPQVRSIANSRSSGTVRAHNGTRVVTSIAPRSGKNVSGTVTRLTCR